MEFGNVGTWGSEARGKPRLPLWEVAEGDCKATRQRPRDTEKSPMVDRRPSHSDLNSIAFMSATSLKCFLLPLSRVSPVSQAVANMSASHTPN